MKLTKRQCECVIRVTFFSFLTYLCFGPMTPTMAQVAALPEIESDSIEMIAMEGGSKATAQKGVASTSVKDLSLSDHKATVVDFEGKVRVRQGESWWRSVEKGMVLKEGDEILTGKEGYLDIAYDARFLNIARIEANTRAKFLSIEPTDLHLEDGTIFNALDGLPKGNQYQVSTQTGVMAVRGTHVVTVVEQGFFTDIAVTQDQKDYISEVEFTHFEGPAAQDGPMIIEEGRQISLEGDVFEMGDVSPEFDQLADSANDHFSDLQDNFPLIDGGPVDLPVPVAKGDGAPDPTTMPITPEGDGDGLLEDGGDELLGGDGNPPSDLGGDPLGNDGPGNLPLLGRDPLVNPDPALNPMDGMPQPDLDPGLGLDPTMDIPLEDPALMEGLGKIDEMMELLVPDDDFTHVEDGHEPFHPELTIYDESRKPDGDNTQGPAGDRTEVLGGELLNEPTTGLEGPDSPTGPAEPPINAAALSEFFGVGMDVGGDVNPEHVGDMAMEVMENFGFDEGSAEQFGKFIETYATLSGGDVSGLAGDTNERQEMPGNPGDMHIPMERFIGGGPGQGPGDGPAGFPGFPGGEGFGFDPNQPFIPELDPIDTLPPEFFAEIPPDHPVFENPFFFDVAFILEENLTLAVKSGLLAGNPGDYVNHGDIDFDLSLINPHPAADPGQDSALETVKNVVYFNAGNGEVHAEYDGIVDDVSAGGGDIQHISENGGQPFKINLPLLACAGGSPEPACSG